MSMYSTCNLTRVTFQSENMHYIEETVGAKITVDAKWSGIHDGVTFDIRHKTVSGIRDAEYLISQVLETVLQLKIVIIPKVLLGKVHQLYFCAVVT